MFKAHVDLILMPALLVGIVMMSPLTLAADVDPTSPFGMSGSGSYDPLKLDGGIKLTSIIHGDGIHTAVINGKIYKMFDYVGEYKITAINNHSVILRNKTERLKIDVFKSKGFKSKVVDNTVAN